MQIDASFIVAVGAIITAILSYISSRSVDKRAARKDEVLLLREEVERLQKRVDELTSDNDRWRIKFDRLYKYVLILRKLLTDNGISVPEMIDFSKESDEIE